MQPSIYPLAVIDFEASSLDISSFPIEVGVAIAREAGGDIEVWSTLIKPDDAWNVPHAWDPEAQRVHGVARRQLATGRTPAEVMGHLNALLAPIGHAWCDDGKYDPFWFGKLRKAAPGLHAAFQLRNMAALVQRDRRTHNRFADAIAATEAPHRAGPDAERLCQAIIQTFALTDTLKTER